MAMAKAKLFCRVMKMKRLVNSISVQKLHTQSISSTPISLLLKRYLTDDYDDRKVNLLTILKYPDTDITEVVVENSDLPDFKDCQSFENRGRINGLLCLTDRNQNIRLSNSATNEFHTLPPSILTKIGHAQVNCVGFGYDPKSRDFKVVRIFISNDITSNFKHVYQAELYNRTTDRWTKIPIPTFNPRIFSGSFEIHNKGIYYWLSGSALDRETFLTFDFTDEVFRTLPFPKSYASVLLPKDNFNLSYLHGLDDLVSLMIWKGSIVLSHKGHVNDEYFDLWALHYDETSDGGVSWFKLSTIGPLYGVLRPLLFVNSDELLMESMNGNVFSYNVITKEVKNLPMIGTLVKGSFIDQCLLSTSNF